MKPLSLVTGRFACPRHPRVQVELDIPALPFCARCGKPLRRLYELSTQPPLFPSRTSKKENHYAS